MSSHSKYICIHGHFYQPPRENPWLNEIEQQPSANPYRDWNERITAECYGPNSSSRILNEDKKIIRIQNNYAKISFNFGATLLSWMESSSYIKDVYGRILEADKESQKQFEGHGSAIAQVYNHIIMPLAKREMKETQVKWGIADFEHRFNRKPEGMWLAETAVDIETLEVLAENNIKFTLLSPYQAHLIRPKGSDKWQDVTNGIIDTRRAYKCSLPSGKSIALFFYNKELSQAVAFENLLNDGKQFADKLMGSFRLNDDEPQLVNIATDGETYGHHHKLGDMALAYCVKTIEDTADIRLINYGQFLELFPPTYEVQVYENTSWSCAHGVGRWKENCGCKMDTGSSYNQEWRAPLRESLDWLNEKASGLLDRELLKYAKNPKLAKEDYIDLIINRRDDIRLKFIHKHQKYPLDKPGVRKMFRLLEMFRHTQLMYTSCGWFFDEISGIEPTQIMVYAERILQLYEEYSKESLELIFLDKLQHAKSNIPEMEDGHKIFLRFARPRKINFVKIVMHRALSAIFTTIVENQMYNYGNYFLKVKKHLIYEAGLSKIVAGEGEVHSIITQHVRKYQYVLIYVGLTYFTGRVFDLEEDEDTHEFQSHVITSLIEKFKRLEVMEAMSELDRLSIGHRFDFHSLSREHQNDIFQGFIKEDLGYAVSSSEQIYLKNYATLSLMNILHLEIPTILKRNINLVINFRIIDFLKGNSYEHTKLEQMALEVKQWNVELYNKEVVLFGERKVLNAIKKISLNFEDTTYIEVAMSFLAILKGWNLSMNLWEVQNHYFKIVNLLEKAIEEKKNITESTKTIWVQKFQELGTMLDIEF